MDDIVKQALAKWPNVPDCYGWLALDARGHWRMRDERAQHLGLPGDRLTNPALVGFINRNYGCDARGCWFFQNGPQRVFVELACTPYIARTTGDAGLATHTGEPLSRLDGAWLTPDGVLLVQSGPVLAQLDDRDLAQLATRLVLDGAPADAPALLAWLDGGPGALALDYLDQRVPVGRIDAAAVPARFGFVRRPAA
jgi:hypothetical protein